MSYHINTVSEEKDISRKQDTRSTGREKAGILACFAAAAALVCGVALTMSPETLPQMGYKVASSAFKFVSIGSLFFHFVATKAELSENASDSARQSLEHLRQTAEIYKERLGLRKTPKIRIARSLAARFLFRGGAAAGFFFHKRHVVFCENVLKEESPPVLESLLGHEMAHIKKNHFWQRIPFIAGLAVMSGVGILGITPSYTLLALIMMHSRCCEFQADRIGAAVSGRHEELAEFLAKNHYIPSGLKKTEPAAVNFCVWKYSEMSLFKKAMSLAGRLAIAPLKAASYIFTSRHPSIERRVERLKMPTRPKGGYDGDSLKVRVLRLLFS